MKAGLEDGHLEVLSLATPGMNTVFDWHLKMDMEL
jgi:hypothetical protein